MIRRRWLNWCKELLFGRFASGPRQQTARRRPLAVEELGPRWLPSTTDQFLSALPIALNGPALVGLNGPSLVGPLNPAPAYYTFSVTESGRLVTELTPTGGATRLTLWSQSGTVLMQSDGSTAASGRIDLHLTGSVAGTTYYLEVERLSGAGSFTLEADYAPATPPFQTLPLRGVLWGHPSDLNGDGTLDMAVANFRSDEVFVLMGRGDGTFAPAVSYAVGAAPNDVIAADFNGDHTPDLISANFEGSLSMMLGRGDGTFADEVRIPLGMNPSALAAGDFDGDGHTDLAVADFGTGQTYVLFGKGDATFAAPVAYAVGDGPYELIAGDFNGDHRADLAVANYNDNAVSVLMGKADGTFLPQQVVAVGEGPYGMAVADFNRDGRLDIATANYTTNDVSVLLSRGDGTFTVGGVAAGMSPYAVAAGDFNNDGNPDIAATNFSDGTLSVFAGRGDGTFGPQVVVRVGASPALIVAADFNQDGRTDLAHGDYSGHVSINLGRGDGTFLIPAQPAPGGSTYSTAIGDFNRDGRLDLATANYNTSDVQIFLGRGDGTFRAGGRYSVGSDPIATAAADLNRDGILDLIASNYSTGNVSILLGRGDGSFGAPQFFATGGIPYRAVVKDFNGDGILDLATPNFGSDSVSVLIGRGDGTFADPLEFAVGAGPTSLCAVDFDGDGKLDLVTTDFNSDSVSVLFGRGDGTFGGVVQLATGDGPRAAVVDDFNGDGCLDLAAANMNGGSVSVFLGQLGGGFLSRIDFATGFAPGRLVAADLNRDGHLDLTAVSYLDNRLGVFLGAGDGTFRPGESLPVGDEPYGDVVGDFNADGSPDLVTCNFSSSDVTVLLNNGDGTFGRRPRTPVPLGPVAMAQGDLNHDGFADLVTADYAAGTVSVRLSRGDGTFRDPVAFAVGAGPSAVTLADANRDGRLDILVANSLDGTVNVLLGIGDGTFQNAFTTSVGITPTALAAGDLNADGFSDLVVADYSSGAVTVLLNNGYALPTLLRYSVGQGPSAISLADFNGDGIHDIIVANSLSHDVTVLLGRGDGTFRTLTTVPVSGAPVALAVGDVNGDGRLDVVTANPGDGSVTVLLGRGDGTFRAPTRIAIGTAPASVRLGDFNGDGKLDLAVADYNANAIHILLGRGDGSFQAQTSVRVGSYPSALVMGDFNNDGRLDLATANTLGTATSAVLGLGTGEFTESARNIPPVQSPPLVADFNRDGIPDVVSLRQDGTILFRPGQATPGAAFGSPVVVNHESTWAARSVTMGTGLGMTALVAVNARTNMDCLYVWVGNGFTRIYSGNLGTDIPSAVVTGDVNGDGLNDLVVGSATSGDIYITLQRTNDDFIGRAWDYEVEAGVGFASLALTDMNGDGLNDLVFTEPASGTVGIILNDPVTPFAKKLRFRAGGGLIAISEADGELRLESRDVPTAVVVGSFDEGSVPDLAVLNRDAQQVTILRGDGYGGMLNPDPVLSLPTGLDPISLAKGDFNGDGRLDLVVLNAGDENLSIYLQNATGGFTEVLSRDFNGQMARPSAGSEPVGISVFDVNRDGITDLLASDPEGDVLTLLGNGDGTFRPYERLDFRVALAVSDQNEDGTHEIAFADRNTDRITLWDDYGNRAFVQDRSDGVRDPNAVRLADLNRDGITDLIATNGGGNAVLVYLGLREAEFGPALRFFVGTNPGAITVGDLNDDGIPDLVIANEGSDDLSILLGEGRGSAWTFTPGPRLQAGSKPTATVVRDVTGDGIADILVANGEANTVYLLRGVGVGFFDDQRPVVFHTGDNPVQLFVGDFDTQMGLDLVTVNAGSNDLTVFSGLGAGRTVETLGSGSVQAIAGYFTGAASLDLIVVSEDGQFTLLQETADGFGATRVFDPGLTRISDMALASFGDGIVQVYVALQGEDVAVPVTLALSDAESGDILFGPGGPDFDPGDPEGNPGDDTTPVSFPRSGDDTSAGDTTGDTTVDTRTDSTPLFATDFSANVEAPFELLATLVLAADGSAVVGDFAPSAAQLSLLPEWYVGEAGEEFDGGAVTEGNATADQVAQDRNSLITGASVAPLLDYLAARPQSEKRQPEVAFPSPLGVFDADGRLLPDQVAPVAADSTAIPGGQTPSEGAPESSVQSVEGSTDEFAAAEWLPRWEVLGAVALSSALIYIALRVPSWCRRKPVLPSLNVRGIEGDRCERDRPVLS